MHTECHQQQKERKRMQVMAGAVLRESVGKVEEARRHRDNRGEADERRLNSQEARAQSENERRAGENQRLAAEGRMYIRKGTVEPCGHEEQRIEVPGKMFEAKEMRPRIGKNEYAAVEWALVANFVEGDVHDRHNRASRYEPQQITDAPPAKVKQREIYRPYERKIVARQRGERGEASCDRRT